MSVNLKASTASFVTEIQRANAEAKRAMRETQAEVKESNHSLALFGEAFGVTVPRHIRTFVSELPGVSKAMSVAFDGLAILVVIKVISEAVAKVRELSEAFHKAGESGRAIAEGWEKIGRPLEQSNLQLDLALAKAQNVLAKLEGRPQNALAEALAELALRTEELSGKLRTALTDAQNLFAANDHNFLMRVATNSSGTGQAQEIRAKAQDALGKLLHDSNYDTNVFGIGQSMAYDAERAKQANLDAANPHIAHDSAHPYSGVDPTTANSALDALIALGKNLMHDVSATKELTTTNAKIKQDEDAKASATKAAEAARKASEKIIHDAEDALAQYKAALAKMGTKFDAFDERGFWNSRLEKATPGTTAYQEFSRRAGAADQAAVNEQRATADELNKTFAKLAEDQSDRKLDKDTQRGLEDVTKATKEYLNELAKASELMTSAKYATAELGIQQRVRTGQLSEVGAAQERAALHTEEYKEKLAALNAELIRIANTQGLSDLDKRTRSQGVNNQIAQLNAGHAQQSEQDATAARGVLEVYWDSAIKLGSNAQSKLSSTILNAQAGVNAQIANMIEGQKTSWSGLFRSIANSLIQLSLQMAEGNLLKGLGGSLHIPGFASGGDPDPYGVSVVGENGPELFTPHGVSGTITPNSQLKGFNSGGYSPTFNIDATGTNAAEVDMRVKRGMAFAYQQAMSDSKRAQYERGRRLPSSRRS